MSTANWNHRTNAQAYSVPETDDGPRFDHHGPMPNLPQPVSALPNGRASVKRAALAGRLAGAAVAAALFVGAPVLATLTASPAAADLKDPRGDEDKDLLSNGEETQLYKTNPIMADSDVDGINDRDELFKTFTKATDGDTDDDGCQDGYELNNNIVKTDPRQKDMDGDTIDDCYEITLRTDPTKADTDGDGVDDGQEFTNKTDPRVADAPKVPPKDEPKDEPKDGGTGDRDGDGMKDEDEINGWYQHGTYVTNPDNPDTDGDGVNDGAEDDNGTNPNDPNDN